MNTPSSQPSALRLAWPFGPRQSRLPARPMHPHPTPALLWRAWHAPQTLGWWPARAAGLPGC